MKSCIVYFLLFLAVLSCEKLEPVNPLNPTSSLEGKWELESAACFCFFPDDFDFGAHTLTFNSSNNTVVIENSGETSFITKAGTYSFSESTDMVTIDSALEYLFELKGDSLVLRNVDNPEIADDEISLTYSKSR